MVTDMFQMQEFHTRKFNSSIPRFLERLSRPEAQVMCGVSDLRHSDDVVSTRCTYVPNLTIFPGICASTQI